MSTAPENGNTAWICQKRLEMWENHSQNAKESERNLKNCPAKIISAEERGESCEPI